MSTRAILFAMVAGCMYLVLILSACSLQFTEARQDAEERLENIREHYLAISESYEKTRDDVVEIITVADEILATYEADADLSSPQQNVVEHARIALDGISLNLIRLDANIQKLHSGIQQADTDAQQLIDAIKEIEQAQSSVIEALRNIISSLQLIR